MAPYVGVIEIEVSAVALGFYTSADLLDSAINVLSRLCDMVRERTRASHAIFMVYTDGSFESIRMDQME